MKGQSTTHFFCLVMLFTFFLLAVDLATLCAQGPVDIKITTIQMKHQQMGIGIDRLAKYINERLGSRVRIRTYPAAQLYTGQEEVQALMKGEIEMAYVIASNLEPLHPNMQIRNLPFLFPNFDICYKILDGPIGEKIHAPVEQKGIHILGSVSSGTPVISNNKHPIKKVEDFKGLKIRSYGPMGASCLKALGAISVVTASEETYTALQTGVIDGALTPASVFVARKYYEVQKFVTDAGMMNATLIYLIANAKWWKDLPSEIRNGIKEAADRLIREQRAEIVEDDQKNLKEIQAKGCKLEILTEAEFAQWKRVLDPVYKEFGPRVGEDLLKQIQQEVDRLYKPARR